MASTSDHGASVEAMHELLYCENSNKGSSKMGTISQ